MTSKIIVNNIQSDTGISTITISSPIALSGGVTGGVTGALTGAANQYVSELAAENLAKEKAAAIKKSTEELNNKVTTIIGDELKKVGIQKMNKNFFPAFL